MPGMTSMDDDIVSVGAPLPRIAAVQALGGRQVRVTWRNGKSVNVDLAPVLLSRRIFIPLRDDDDLFLTVRVNEDGNAIEWDGGIELTALWIESLPPIGMDNDEFRSIMSRLDYSLDGMASALDISRRQVANYRGSEPIPNHIAYAARYLLERAPSAREVA